MGIYNTDYLGKPDMCRHWTRCCPHMGCCWTSANLEGTPHSQ